MIEALDHEVESKIDGQITKIIEMAGKKRGRKRDVSKSKGAKESQFDRLYDDRDALRRAANVHSWTRATVSSIAKSAVGGGFSIIRHPIYGRTIPENITEEEIWNQLEDVYNFFYGVRDVTTHIQDTTTPSQKIYYTIVSFFLYGQAAWHLRRDENDTLFDFDILPGLVFPNINASGKFLSPAYYYRPWNSGETFAIRNPGDIMYITWPGVDFSVYGNSEYISAGHTAIPADLYAAQAYKSHFENLNAPYNGVWTIDPNTSDEDFYSFLRMIENRYSGVENWGRNPLIIRGEARFEETRSRSNDDAPYLQGRTYNQEEVSAIAGVPGAKLGLAGQTTKSNYREQRREFHETTLRPIFEMVEQAIYQQVFVRGFGIRQWALSFNNPDFTNALEDASIYTRYINYSVMSPNEARSKLGLPKRNDEYGDMFYQPSNIAQVGIGDVVSSQENQTREDQSQQQGGREHDAEDIPSNDKPTVADEESNKMLEGVLDELRKWKRFAIRVAENKRDERPFNAEFIPMSTAETIQSLIEGKDKDTIKEIFDNLISVGEND